QTTHEGDSEPTVAESTVDQNVTESEQTTDVEQPEGAQFESSIQTTHEGDSEPTAAESTVDQNVTESEQTTDVDQPEGAQFESSIQTTHEGDREPTVAESTVDQNVTESQSSAPQVAEAITSPKADENQRIHNPSEYEQLIRNNTADRLWQSFLEPNQNEEIDSIFRTSNFEPQSLELGELDIEFDSLEDQNLFESNTNNNLHSETGDVHDFTSKANSAPKNDSSRETSMFEKAFQAIALQNQKTIEAITSLVETVITQQSAIFEKQNVMFEKIMHNQQEMMQQVLKQQTQIFGSIEQLSHRIGLVSGEHVLGVSDPLQQPSTEIEQWAELLAEYKSNQVEIAEKKNTIAQIDKLIDETKKHNPEELAEVMNPANVAAKTSEQQIENTYQQIIDELKTHKHEIDRGFKQLPKEVKALFGKALNKTDTLITISELKSDTYTCMAKIKNVVEDVYSAANDTYHRGLPMSIALGEVLRNSSQKNCPPSALTSVAAACITGEVKPTDKISEDVINGVITADEYYQQCQSILGDDQFSTQLGDEYQEYLQLNKQQQTNSFEQAVAPPFTDHQIDNQPSM
ncbi:hypothetical protein, partial [Vibrio harveyi]|uniref:hypothetical protein n=1 Tax=Vibrio harveyi TaxID=669 RepID=UPI00248177A2